VAAAVAGKAALSPSPRRLARERGKHGCTKYDTCRILPLLRFTPASPHCGSLYADYLGESVTFRPHAKCIVSKITFCTESDVFLTHRLYEKGNAPAAGRHLVWQSGASRRDGLNCRQLCANVLDHIQQHFP
jgi:hypothetical protein